MANKLSIFDITSLLNRDYVTEVLYEDKVNYNVRDKIVKIGEGDYDFIVEKEVYEEGRCNRDDYIESFSSDVGVENILRKVQLTGDTTLVNRCNPQYLDTRGMPTNNMEADEAIAKGQAAAKELGIGYSEEELNKYIQDKIQEALAAKNNPVESEVL